MPFLNHWWLIGLLIIVLIVFGPGKLPQIGGAVGQALREFRKATNELKDEVAKATAHEESAAPVTASAVATPVAVTPEPSKEHTPESTKA